MSSHSTVIDLEVDRGQLERVRHVRRLPVELADGDARLRIDAFALTSNNITYAVFGDMMNYWNFFPPADAGWGRVPVWGFADVVESRSPDLAVGERLYGYLPMSEELVISVGRADDRGVMDMAPHRAPMAAAYNRYQRCSANPVYRTDREAHQMILYPLFFTSFVADDFLADQHDLGAEQLVISSASAKTSIGIAFQAAQRGQRVVGLTSAGNQDFVRDLGVYDDVITYDEVPSMTVRPSNYIDVAGDRSVTHAVHTTLGDALAASITLGGTHWDAVAAVDAAPLPGPTPQFFFAPTQIAKRNTDWGRDGLDRRMGEAWTRFADWVGGWVEFQDVSGPDQVAEVYGQLLAGRVDPRLGFACTMATTEQGSPS